VGTSLNKLPVCFANKGSAWYLTLDLPEMQMMQANKKQKTMCIKSSQEVPKGHHAV
jgi:hypothetical protein